MPQLLSADLWLQVLNCLDYFDLCSVKRVSKLLNHCCKVRSVEEDLFVASYQEHSIKSKYRAGKKEIELHPVLSHSLFILRNGPRVLEEFGKPWHGKFQVKRVNGDPERASEYQDLDGMGKLGYQNATNPPLYRFELFDRNWTTDTLRDWRYHINDSSRALDAAETQYHSTKEASASSSKSKSSRANREPVSKSARFSAVTVNDILGALARYFEKDEDALYYLEWNLGSFSYNAQDEALEYDHWSAYHPHYWASEESEDDEDERFCKVEEFYQQNKFNLSAMSKEEKEERRNEMDMMKPLCACWSCQNIHPWNEKCWEKFFQLNQAQLRLAEEKEAVHSISAGVIILQSKEGSELKLNLKEGIVADLNQIAFAW